MDGDINPTEAPAGGAPSTEIPAVSKTRLRVRFTKSGDLRWISHRDLARVWERLLRRAGLELAFSQGFHPKPRISFPSALALGIEALDEVVELEVLGNVDLAEIHSLIAAEMPAGMELLELTSPQYGWGKAKAVAATYQMTLPAGMEQTVSEKIATLLQSETLEIVREQPEKSRKKVVCDLRAELFDLRIQGQSLTFTLPMTDGASIRPSELLEAIGGGALLESGQTLQRTQLHLSEPAEPVHESAEHVREPTENTKANE